MSESQRNFLILGVIVLVVAFSTTAQIGVGLLGLVVKLAFTAVIILALWQFYRRNETRIGAMPLGPRVVFLASAIALVGLLLLITFVPIGAGGGIGTGMFFAILAACLLGMYLSWQKKPW